MKTEDMKLREYSKYKDKVENVMRCINVDSIIAQHKVQSPNKAVGIDGVSKSEYAINIKANITELVTKMKKMQYIPKAARRVYIPKSNGRLRGLGLPSYEDKLVQGAFASCLTSIYEERFLNCSFGFRPKRSAHDAIREIVHASTRGKVSYVVEADIKGFFDNVDHEWMMKFLEHDIADKVFLRYIKRFLKAGVMENGKYLESEKGTPQGGLISPVLANVYLHYVLDMWAERIVKPRAKGQVYYVRYADDFVFMCQYKVDAENILRSLPARLAKFGLEVAEDKTRYFPFGRFCKEKETFDFLGFTIYGGTTLNGKYCTKVRTSSKKLKAKRAAIKEWLWKHILVPTDELLRELSVKLRGHNQYYGVSGNLKSISKFYQFVRRRLYRLLKRKSQRSNITYEKLKRIWNEYITPPSIKVYIGY